MSYLNLSKGIPGFNKVVISLWFRVPQESIDKAYALRTWESGKLLDGIIPLVVMGERGFEETPTSSWIESVHSYHSYGGTAPATGNSNSVETEVIGDCPEHGAYSYLCQSTSTYEPATAGPVEPFDLYENVERTEPSGEQPLQTNPTCIGIDCSSEGYASLYVNFESDKKSNIRDFDFTYTLELGDLETSSGSFDAISGTYIYTGCSIPFGLLLPFYDIVEEDNTVTTNIPFSVTATGKPKRVYTDISEWSESTGAITSDNYIQVAADTWHHALISCYFNDVKSHGGVWHGSLAEYVDSAAKLWVALDDKNYTGNDLAEYWVETDPNEFVTEGAYHVAGTSREDDNPGPVATYTLDKPKIPSDGKPLGLPGTVTTVNNIYHVELAEFQMWTEVTLDTGVETNRRAFIDYERDENGKIIKDKDGKGTLKPVSMDKAEALLGKKPEIKLHGSSKWKNGKNTGTTGMDYKKDPPQEIPSGQFQPVAEIKAYKPDPSIVQAPKS